MLIRSQLVFVFGVWLLSSTVAAQPVKESNHESGNESTVTDDLRTELESLRAEVEALKQQNKDRDQSVSQEQDSDSAADESDNELKLGAAFAGWEIGVHGYFRAPLTIGISNRPSPDNMDGSPQTQLSYGPNRIMDSNYYSFAYTRLQEQDWAELSVYARRKHVDAEVGWMGYWFQSIGFRNPDAGWAPGIARLTLDTDFRIGSINTNVALTGGAWWPRFGYHKKYDTYTLGLFRQLGEQLKLTVPINSDFKLTLYQGFGSGRDGSYNYQIGEAPKIYGAKTGLNLLHYEHLRFEYRDYVSLGIHYSDQKTRDPNLYPQDVGEKTYSAVRKARLSVVGGEITLSAPRAGSLWISPSYIRVQNGWALAENGTEVMHSLGGAGFAGNYMGFGGSVVHSTGTGNTVNLGFQYENTLSNILGKKQGSMIPDVTASVFGLMAIANLDLPAESAVTQDQIKQFKWGVDAEAHIQKWLGFMLRYDSVNYDLEHPAYIFSAITARLTISSHFLSGERIYLQYSHYFYGDYMTIAGKWPWGQPLIAGSDIVQGGPYTGWAPDRDVLKIQAEIAF